MAGGKKYYVVWVGRQTGVFSDWSACKQQIDGFENARYMSFASESEAAKAFAEGWQAAYALRKSVNNTATADSKRKSESRPEGDVLAVDAACSGNPGKMEYRAVYLRTGQEVFHLGPLTDGTNNIGEFLAIVHALALETRKGLRIPIYSDSVNALLWVRKKKCGTKLAHTGRNDEIFDLIERAENWLKSHDYSQIPLLKWQTEIWGEIPADFGRK